MSGFEQAVASLPERLQTPLRRLPLDIQQDIHEIRLREDSPVVLSGSTGDWLLTEEGQPTTLPVPRLLSCTHAQIEACFLHLCEYSVHSHQWEILQGYISTRQGLRVGIAGSAVMEQGQMISMRRITSLCVRVHRTHSGCADALLAGITHKGRLSSALICGEPSSGKTSLLRDAARQLAAGYQDRRFRITVVDERGELSAQKGLRGCDVLLHFPKGAGIQQAVRCLAPDVVVFDELGNMEEAQAVVEGLNAGVSALSTAHGHRLEDILHRPPVYYALRHGGFEKIVLLSGRQTPGEIVTVYDVEDVWREGVRTVVDPADRSGDGALSFGDALPTGGDFAVV